MSKVMKVTVDDYFESSGKVDLPIPEDYTFQKLKSDIKTAFKYKRTNYIILYTVKGKKNFKEITKKSFSEFIDTLNEGNKLYLQVRMKIDLTKLKQLLKTEMDEENLPFSVIQVNHFDAETTRKRLALTVEQFLDDISEDPAHVAFYIPSRSAENVAYDHNAKMVLLGNQTVERQFRHLSSVSSIVQLTGIMRYINEILLAEKHATKRHLFYRDVNLFGNQRVSDGLLEDVGALLRASRSSLNVIASAKGKVIGKISFREGGDLIDCTQGIGGHAITPMLDQVTDLQSDAEFVLVIEKDAVFQDLAEDKFFNYIPSVMITASGQPDMATRMFIKRVHEELELPILGFVDADPYGLDILRVYTIGSKALSFETVELAVPDIHWLGLLPSDIKEYNIPKSVLIPMNDRDIKRADDLLAEDFVKSRPEWEKQIKIMKNTGKKAEIQALASKDWRFMTNTYLPTKIDSGDWV